MQKKNEHDNTESAKKIDLRNFVSYVTQDGKLVTSSTKDGNNIVNHTIYFDSVDCH